MAAPPTFVLRVPQADDKGAHIILGVTPTGPRPLDLKLEASEGTGVYATSLKQSQVSQFRAKSAPCSEAEWEDILTAVLRDGKPEGGIEVAAGIRVDDSITLTFRKKIQAFGQRIGELALEFKEDEGIEPYDWCQVALASREGLKEELAAATSKAAGLEKAVAELSARLEELVRTKEEEEPALLEKFKDLLNQKKLKIREQQRVIAAAAGAQSGHAPGADAAETRRGRGAGHTPEPSRRAKRKAGKQAMPDGDEDSEDGYERMDVDTKDDIPLDDEQQTTEAETETEGDEDGEDEPPSANLRGSTKSQHKEAASKEGGASPPPPRRLPFALSKSATSRPVASSSRQAAAGEGGETESDDEL